MCWAATSRILSWASSTPRPMIDTMVTKPAATAPTTSFLVGAVGGGTGSAALVGLLGQVVGQVHGRLDGLAQAEAVLQDQTREVAGVDAAEEVVTRGDRRVRPRVVHEAGRVVEAGSLGGRLPEP